MTCGTYLTNAPGIYGGASAFYSARQLGHGVEVAQKHYVGLIRGIPRDAHDLENAMQITKEVEAVIADAECLGQAGALSVVRPAVRIAGG